MFGLKHTAREAAAILIAGIAASSCAALKKGPLDRLTKPLAAFPTASHSHPSALN